MPLEIQESSNEGVVILTLKGRLTVGESTSLRDRVTQLVNEGHNRMVMDLSHVEYIDSTGLGSLVIQYTTLKKQGGALKLVNPNKRNIELLLLTKLHTIFEVFNELPDAVNSFFPDRAIKRFDILAFVKQNSKE